MRSNNTYGLALYALGLLVASGPLPACGPQGPETPTEESPCDLPGEISVELGKGTGLKYQTLEPGDPVGLVIGSQIGLEAPVGVRTLGIPLNELSLVSVSIWVDGYSIGLAEHERDDCKCVEAQGQVDTPVLIDVLPHPDVASVVQLEGREASVNVQITGTDGLLFEEDYPITITLP